MIARETAVVICVALVAFAVLAALKVSAEVIGAVAAAAVVAAGAMSKLYDRDRGGSKGGDA